MNKVLIIEEDQVADSETFYIRDERGEHALFTTSHDEHGWSGMATVKEGMISMADLTGIEVEHRVSDNYDDSIDPEDE